MVKKLHVGNLPYEVTEDALRALFGPCGEVTEITFVVGARRGRSLGSAFVTMKDEEDRARAVAELDGAVFDDRPLHVEAVEPASEGAAPVRSSLARALHRARCLVRFARDAVGASAASMFLSRDGGGALRGVVGELRGTRSSPASSMEWPAVEHALRTREMRRISIGDATAAEVGWFEPGRIASTLCVPLVDIGDAIGVLFFDFGASSRAGADSDRAFLADVGARCARALRRAGA